MKRIISALIAVCILAALGAGCAKGGTASSAAVQAEHEAVTLRVAGPWADFAALENIAAEFTKQYPYCTVEYEYIQNFNENVLKRLSVGDTDIDFFISDNIQPGADLLPYAMELSQYEDAIDLSGTFDGLIDNFRMQSSDDAEKNKIYTLPLGGELRGMYVNTTLLDTLGIAVPTNRAELLDACQKLTDAGYVPLGGNPALYSSQLMYPYICNIIANADDYDAMYKDVDSRIDGVSEIFREPMEFIYDTVVNKYYYYKYVETEFNRFTDVSNEGYARSFLNITGEDGNYTKADDVGGVAFMPSTQSVGNIIAKTKDDYHSAIEYEFILSPVSDEGGYAYLSPGKGISVNVATTQPDTCITFLNFIMQSDNNIALCNDMGYVPNTKDALDIVSQQFDIPQSQVSQLGQVTFSYNFYSVISDTLIEISKGNNPKYMNTDANGNPEMYPFEYYMENFEQRFHE